ncbi:hypothetical protein [Streptomyces sp. NPDC093261]|uniref:hypothetical protein n=1 Tax=Streptomyces sp. NPDC093261 TaxID=3366037 RepID=UPI003809EB3D
MIIEKRFRLDDATITYLINGAWWMLHTYEKDDVVRCDIYGPLGRCRHTARTPAEAIGFLEVTAAR